MSKGFFQLLTCQQDIGQVHDLPRGVGANTQFMLSTRGAQKLPFQACTKMKRTMLG